MKLITAIIPPSRLERVKLALAAAGVHGMTVSEARGFGSQKGYTEVYRGAEYTVDLIPKLRLEILTSDEEAEVVTEAIVEGARTGSIGDGKVWSVPVSEVTRVRTGETGVAAL